MQIPLTRRATGVQGGPGPAARASAAGSLPPLSRLPPSPGGAPAEPAGLGPATESRAPRGRSRDSRVNALRQPGGCATLASPAVPRAGLAPTVPLSQRRSGARRVSGLRGAGGRGGIQEGLSSGQEATSRRHRRGSPGSQRGSPAHSSAEGRPARVGRVWSSVSAPLPTARARPAGPTSLPSLPRRRGPHLNCFSYPPKNEKVWKRLLAARENFRTPFQSLSGLGTCSLPRSDQIWGILGGRRGR